MRGRRGTLRNVMFTLGRRAMPRQLESRGFAKKSCGSITIN